MSSSARGTRTIRRILDAAANLFGSEGYQGATMLAVARAAGVSKGLLHYHFQSKEHLLIEAQRAAFRQLFARFEDRFAQGDVGMEAALEALDSLWESIREMRGWTPFLVEIMALTAQQGPTRRHLDTFYDEVTDLLHKGVLKVFADQRDQLVIPPERLTWVVRAAVHGLVVELAFCDDETSFARVDQLYRDFRLLFSRVALVA